MNQTAALQTAGTDQTKELPANENLNKEEDLNKEIEKQMAEYRNQQNRTEKVPMWPVLRTQKAVAPPELLPGINQQLFQLHLLFLRKHLK